MIENKNNMEKWLKEGRPGWSIRDEALANAANLVNFHTGKFDGDDVGIVSWQPMPWTEELRKHGVTYKAPPEIAARDVKAAARLFGAGLVGIAELVLP